MERENRCHHKAEVLQGSRSKKLGWVHVVKALNA
jgi:hypothetical protein